MSADPALSIDLVVANHILSDHGVVDAFGHVSARHDKHPDRFLLARNMAPGSVTADDVLEFHLDGSPVDRQGPRPYLERFIHGEIYAARPDVMAVVHSHSHSIVPLSISVEQRLCAVSHMAGFIGTDYLHDNNAGQGTKQVFYHLPAGLSGFQRVSLRWTAHTNRASTVSIEIRHRGGTA